MTSCYRTHFETKHPEEWRKAVFENGLKNTDSRELEQETFPLIEGSLKEAVARYLVDWIVSDDQVKYLYSSMMMVVVLTYV